MIKMQAERSAARLLGTVIVVPCPGWLVWRKNQNAGGKENFSEEFKVLERQLDFILKATEEVLWSPPYFM